MASVPPVLLEPSRAVARVARKRAEIDAAFVFGSVAHGRARPDSDLDVAVLLRDALPSAQALDYRLRLGNELQTALGRGDIDVIVLNDAPPLLAHRVLSRGVAVFERSRRARVRFQVDTARRHADVVPVLERYARHLKQSGRVRPARGRG